MRNAYINSKFMLFDNTIQLDFNSIKGIYDYDKIKFTVTKDDNKLIEIRFQKMQPIYYDNFFEEHVNTIYSNL